MRSSDELTTAGYSVYTGPSILRHHAIALYQKRILDSDGNTRYFINVYQYPAKDMPEIARDRYRFTIEAQLYRNDPLCSTMDLHLHHEPTMTPSDIESFYANAYTSLGCCLDPHN
jgi:hypothetical protein